MDAKVHPARPVHHRDAEEMIGLARRAPRHQIGDEWVAQVADHLGAVGRHNFREPCLELGRDFHPSALADAPVAEPVDFPERQERSTKLPLVASVGREQVALIVPVAKVVGRRAQIHQVAEKQKAAHPVGATARRVAVQELGAKEQERVFPKRLVSQVLRQVQPGGQAAEPPAQRAPGWQRKAEQRARQLVQAAR
jgi:hypothetical protein